MSRIKVEAEMVGQIVAVNCAVGDGVTADQPLLAMEAMKMEFPVAAPVAGTVAEIRVAVGDAVDEHQTLVILQS